MAYLEKEGVFKSQPISWHIKKADSGAVAVAMEFRVVSELENGEWISWDEWGEHTFRGDWWIVKKDGSLNQGAIDQLSASLGWDGNLNAILGDPPRRVVQVTVKTDTYKNKTRFKGSWMNPENYAGGPQGGADAAEVNDLQAEFGGLLRAAASAGAVQPAPAPAPSNAGPQGAAPVQTGAGAPTDGNGDDIPF